MAPLIWFTIAVALWHFTVFFPDRFWGGIVGAFVGALFGAVIFGLLLHAGVPSRDDTTLISALEAIPGAILGMAAIYFIGTRREAADPSYGH